MRRYLIAKQKLYSISGTEKYDKKKYLIGKDMTDSYTEEDDEFFLEFMGMTAEEALKKGGQTLEVSVGSQEELYYIEADDIDQGFWAYLPPHNLPSSEELEEMGYRKSRPDITDIVTVGDEVRRFFNYKKYLEYKGKDKLLKVIPEEVGFRLTGDNPFFNNLAEKQYNEMKEYNMASARNQYIMDLIDMKKTKFTKIASSILATFLLIFVIVPGSLFNSGIKNLQQENYAKASKSFRFAVTRKGHKTYSSFAHALDLADQGKFEEAEKLMESLMPNQPVVKVSIVKGVDDIRYRKAVELFENKEYKQAMDIFESIDMYNNSMDYYYKSGYALGEQLYEQNDLIGAIDSFYRVRKYKDASERSDKLSEQFFAEAMDLYNKGEYAKSEEEFLKISSYNFKNSGDMANQSIYKQALALFSTGKYDEAEKMLKGIYKYHDSSALLREIRYHEAKNDKKRPKSEVLLDLLKIRNHRDVDAMIKSPEFVLYGTWNITDRNGEKISANEFTFDENNLLKSGSNIQGIAISTEDSPKKYEFKDGKFVYDKHIIEIKSSDYDTITFEAISGTHTKVEYKAIRSKELPEIVEDYVSDDITDSDKIFQYLTEYANDKMDFKIVVNGQKIEASMINTLVSKDGEEIDPNEAKDADKEGSEEKTPENKDEAKNDKEEKPKEENKEESKDKEDDKKSDSNKKDDFNKKE